jgi:hypothetical protein
MRSHYIIWLVMHQERWEEPDAEYVPAANPAEGGATTVSPASAAASVAGAEVQEPLLRQEDGADVSAGAGAQRGAWTREGTKEGKVPSMTHSYQRKEANLAAQLLFGDV